MKDANNLQQFEKSLRDLAATNSVAAMWLSQWLALETDDERQAFIERKIKAARSVISAVDVLYRRVQKVVEVMSEVAEQLWIDGA